MSVMTRGIQTKRMGGCATGHAFFCTKLNTLGMVFNLSQLYRRIPTSHQYLQFLSEVTNTQI